MIAVIRFTGAEENIQGYTFRSFSWRYECPKCGKRVKDKFCSRCGEKIEYPEFPEGRIKVYELNRKWFVDERESYIRREGKE